MDQGMLLGCRQRGSQDSQFPLLPPDGELADVHNTEVSSPQLCCVLRRHLRPALRLRLRYARHLKHRRLRRSFAGLPHSRIELFL